MRMKKKKKKNQQRYILEKTESMNYDKVMLLILKQSLHLI